MWVCRPCWLFHAARDRLAQRAGESVSLDAASEGDELSQTHAAAAAPASPPRVNGFHLLASPSPGRSIRPTAPSAATSHGAPLFRVPSTPSRDALLWKLASGSGSGSGGGIAARTARPLHARRTAVGGSEAGGGLRSVAVHSPIAFQLAARAKQAAEGGAAVAGTQAARRV